MKSSNPWQRMLSDAPIAEPRDFARDSIVQLQVSPNDGVPNHPHWSALLYPAVLADDLDIDRIKALFERNGWFRVWDWTVFDYHHFHPTASEVLAVACGSASIKLGGCAGSTRLVGAGDVMILPPGFGHCRKAASEDFVVVGAYPEGQERREVVSASEAALEAALPVILSVVKPRTDPVFGAHGPLLDLWI